MHCLIFCFFSILFFFSVWLTWQFRRGEWRTTGRWRRWQWWRRKKPEPSCRQWWCCFTVGSSSRIAEHAPTTRIFSVSRRGNVAEKHVQKLVLSFGRVSHRSHLLVLFVLLCDCPLSISSSSLVLVFFLILSVLLLIIFILFLYPIPFLFGIQCCSSCALLSFLSHLLHSSHSLFFFCFAYPLSSRLLLFPFYSKGISLSLVGLHVSKFPFLFSLLFVLRSPHLLGFAVLDVRLFSFKEYRHAVLIRRH